MVDDKIVGRYWLCGNSKRRWLVQGNKPTHLGDDSFRADYSSKKDMRRLNISEGEYYCEDSTVKDGQTLSGSDFDGLDFPKLTEEGEIIEIEICKSGKVYWYES